MSSYKIGQIIELTCGKILRHDITEKEIIIPKGTKGIIGGDKAIHYFNCNVIEEIPVNSEIESYDSNGLSVYLSSIIARNLDCDDVSYIKEIIESAFDAIGF